MSTLTEATLASFANHPQLVHKSRHTMRSYVTGLEQLIEHANGGVRHDDMNTVVPRWLETVSAGSQRNRLAAARLYYKLATNGGTLLPGFTPPAPKQENHTPLPNGQDDVALMAMAAPDADLRLIVTLCGTMGMRISEALNLDAEQVNLTDGIIEVFGKGAKWRTIPIPSRSLAIITDATAEGRLVTEYKDSRARAAITRLAKQSGIPRHVSSHDLRATFIRSVWDKTQSQTTTMQLAGHSNWATTLRYLGIDNADHRKAVD